MISLPLTVQQPGDMEQVYLPGAHIRILKQSNTIATKWIPAGASREVLLSWDFDAKTLTLTNDEPGDEEAIIDILNAIGQPSPKYVAGRALADRINGLVDLDIRDLTTNQLKLLLAVAIWNQAGLNLDGTLKHPREWVRRRDDS